MITIMRNIIVAIIFFFAAWNAHAENPAIVILATHDLCPYGCYDENGKFSGIAVSVVRYACEAMNVQLEIIVTPWNRAQHLAKIGHADGFFAGSQNAERDKDGVMSAIIAEQKWNWYLLKDSPLDPTTENFKETARVASFHGANMQKWLKANGYNVTANPYDTDGLVKMLLARRLDAILATNLVAEVIIRRDGLQEMLKTCTLRNKPLGVYFSNRFVQAHPGFVDEFNRHVMKFRANYKVQ